MQNHRKGRMSAELREIDEYVYKSSINYALYNTRQQIKKNSSLVWFRKEREITWVVWCKVKAKDKQTNH